MMLGPDDDVETGGRKLLNALPKIFVGGIVIINLGLIILAVRPLGRGCFREGLLRQVCDPHMDLSEEDLLPLMCPAVRALAWIDTNQNGSRENDEPALPGATFHLYWVTRQAEVANAQTRSYGQVELTKPDCTVDNPLLISGQIYELYVDTVPGYRLLTPPRVTVDFQHWEYFFRFALADKGES